MRPAHLTEGTRGKERRTLWREKAGEWAGQGEEGHNTLSWQGARHAQYTVSLNPHNNSVVIAISQGRS